MALGVEGWLDWTALEPGAGVRLLAEHVAREGGLLSIAHPFSVGDPICTGCAWTYFDLRPEQATHLEVWNGEWRGPHNERALAYWYGLLERGHRVIATVGTDAHGPAYAEEYGFTCTPRTEDARQLRTQLREGRTYLSRDACLDLRVQTPEGGASLGSAALGGTWEVELRWFDIPEGATLYRVVDGERQTIPISFSGKLQEVFEVRRWLNFEIRLPDGDLYLLTNPVFARSQLEFGSANSACPINACVE